MTMNVIEAMETCTAMRYLKEDPVPREVIMKLLHAATRASNPGNSQGWEFVVVEDAVAKAEIGAAVLQGMGPAFANRPTGMDGVQARMYQGAEHLATNFAKVPVWIVGCGRKVYPPHAPTDVFMYSTIYPAAQNLIVAARSLGIGTCFTTFHHVAGDTLRRVCRIPDDVHPSVMIAVGYPERKFMPVRRKPLESVVHWNMF
ncbi:MAG: nitroreductase family protein [Pseudomonadales bacterium]|nr:nitroreductase family protein [Pseudomonadales bacterium]